MELDTGRLLDEDWEVAAKLTPEQTAFLVHEMRRIAINGRTWRYSAKVARETMIIIGDKEVELWPDHT